MISIRKLSHYVQFRLQVDPYESFPKLWGANGEQIVKWLFQIWFMAPFWTDSPACGSVYPQCHWFCLIFPMKFVIPGFKMEDPQVTMGFNAKSCFNVRMIWGTPWLRKPPCWVPKSSDPLRPSSVVTQSLWSQSLWSLPRFIELLLLLQILWGQKGLWWLIPQVEL